MLGKSYRTQFFVGLTLAVVALFLASAVYVHPIYGADLEGWTQFYTNSAGDRFYYESPGEAYSLEGGSSTTYAVKIRIRAISAREGSPVRETTQLMEFDCWKGKYRKLEEEIIRNDGTTYSGHFPKEWSPVSASPLADALKDIACKKVERRRLF